MYGADQDFWVSLTTHMNQECRLEQPPLCDCTLEGSSGKEKLTSKDPFSLSPIFSLSPDKLQKAGLHEAQFENHFFAIKKQYIREQDSISL